MRISTIIPIHNAEPYLPATIASIGNQTHQPQEVLFIDDASHDNSLEVAKRHAEHYNLNARFLNVQYGNAAATRNAGIKIAEGGWVAFLDADDIWEPYHLEQAAALLNEVPDVAYMANHKWLRNNKPEPIPPSLQPKVDRSQTGLSDHYFVELLSQGFHFGHSTVMYRTDRLQEVGGFDETQVRRHDKDLWLRMVAGNTWAWGNDPAMQYRIDTPGSISKNTIDAEYYYLRALLKNKSAYDTPAMQQLIETAARRAMSLAFVDGTREQYQRSKELAWEYLPHVMRMVYRLEKVSPSIFRYGIQGKRRVYTYCRSLNARFMF